MCTNHPEAKLILVSISPNYPTIKEILLKIASFPGKIRGTVHALVKFVHHFLCTEIYAHFYCQLSAQMYLRNDVQRLAAIVSVTFCRFPVFFIKLVGAHIRSLTLSVKALIRQWQSLSHCNVPVRRFDGKLNPTIDRYISDCLTGYRQTGIENQPRWSWITLAYYEFM